MYVRKGGQRDWGGGGVPCDAASFWMLGLLCMGFGQGQKMGVGLDWVEVVCAVDMKRNNVRLAECRGNQLD